MLDRKPGGGRGTLAELDPSDRLRLPADPRPRSGPVQPEPVDLSEGDIPTRPEGALEQKRPAGSRREAWLLAGAAVVVLILGSLAALSVHRWLSPPPAEGTTEAAETAPPASPASPASTPAPPPEVRRLTFDPVGSRLAWVDPTEPEIRLSRLGDGRPSSRLRWAGSAPTVVTGLAFTRDGRRLVATGAGSSPAAQAWDTESGETLWSVALPEDPSAAATSPDPPRVLVLAGTSVRELDVESGATMKEVSGVPLPSGAAPVFSPDGRSVAWGQGTTVRIWSLESRGSPLDLAQPDEASLLAFRPDGTSVAVAAGPATYLWEIATGRQLRRFETGGPVRSLAFRSDGQRLATTTADGIAVWDVPGGKLVERRDVPGRSTGAAAYRPGTDLLALGIGTQVKTWQPGP